MTSDAGHNVVGGGLMGGGAVAVAWIITHLKGWRFRATVGNSPEPKEKEEPPSVREYLTSQTDVERALSEIKVAIAKLETILLTADLPLIKQTQGQLTAEIGAIKISLVGIREDIADLKRCDEDHTVQLVYHTRQIKELNLRG